LAGDSNPNSIIASPEWTEYRKKNGLDPLGMQNTSVALYQRLLPGISNVTLRMRYYGYYAWLSWVYANRIGDTDPKSWQRFIRRAEALFALISQKRGGESGVAGVQWAERTLDEADAGNVLFADDAEPGSPTYYLKQAWGAYGAAYGSQLFEMGILASVPGHEVPVPSPTVGEPIAKAFDEALGELSEKLFEAIQRGSIALVELDELASLTPSEINAEGEERELYQRILFGEAGLDREQDLNRRKTLFLILELAQQLGYAPNVNDVRWALYAECKTDGAPITLSEGLQDHQKRWSLYQTNDLSHICFETLLKFTLDILEGYPAGVPLARLIDEAVDDILSISDPAPETWQSFLDAIDLAQNALSDDDPNAEYPLSQTVMRAARQDTVCDPEGAWAAIRLLAILHKRTKPSFGDLKNELGTFDPMAFRSALTEITFLEKHISEPFRDTLAKLLEERVLRRHLQIALRKLRFQGDYTYLLEPDDGKVRLREKDGPVFTNPRLGPTLTFLKDIHLLDEKGLTELGHQRLEVAV